REVVGVERRPRPGGHAVHDERAEFGAFLFVADEVAHELAAGAVSAFADLALDELFERIGERHVHGGHGTSLGGTAKFAKPSPTLPHPSGRAYGGPIAERTPIMRSSAAHGFDIWQAVDGL